MSPGLFSFQTVAVVRVAEVRCDHSESSPMGRPSKGGQGDHFLGEVANCLKNSCISSGYTAEYRIDGFADRFSFFRFVTIVYQFHESGDKPAEKTST